MAMRVLRYCALFLCAVGCVPVGLRPATRLRTTAPSLVCSPKSKEASQLLEFLQRIAGVRVLSGQHNYPATRSRYSEDVQRKTGNYPAVWGQDFGYGKGRLESIYDRDGMVQEAIRQAEQGSLITLMWHAVSPLDEEPVVFAKSVKPMLDAASWQALLVPGTEVHRRWERQVDTIAAHLKKLQERNIPVLWRPYHEMNGDWFWWGAHPAEFQKLWRMLFERLTCVHRLDNLIWVWSIHPQQSDASVYLPYFPGQDVVDVLGIDTYKGIFSQRDYEALLQLAGGKPIAWTELDRLPSAEVLTSQPRWVWWMSWADHVWRANTVDTVRRLFRHARVEHRRPRG